MPTCLRGSFLRTGILLLLAVLLAAPAVAVENRSLIDTEDLSDELRAAIKAALKEKLDTLKESKNADGTKDRKGTYSRYVLQPDDETFLVSFHEYHAGDATQTVKRLRLTLKPDPDDPKKKKWKIVDETTEDTYQGLHRANGVRCYPFETFSFDRGGMKVNATNGSVCEGYYQDSVSGFWVASADLSYKYTAPKYQDYYSLQKMHEQDFQKDMVFEPKVATVQCDPVSCEDLLTSCFKGLTRKPIPEPGTMKADDVEGEALPELRDRVQKWVKEVAKNRKENAFSGFRLPFREGHRTWTIRLVRDDSVDVGLNYDSWDGFEYEYFLRRDWVFPGFGPVNFPRQIFGYYTEETLANHEPYELELRDDYANRFHEVYSLKGDVEAALVDPEMLEAEIEYGITVKHALRELPFSIASIPRQSAGGGYKAPPLWVNSVQLDGEELTYVKVGPNWGYVILPEEVPAGTKLNLMMNFKTRAIYKVNHAFSNMARFGWMPFVRFADFIDEFELTIKTPSQYKILGIGHKVSEKVEDDVLVTHWRADSPVVFPTVIFGKYFSDKPGFDAKKLDGTVIPVAVHVDEVSLGQLDIMMDFDSIEEIRRAQETIEEFNSGARGIRGKQLRAIAEQAANAINLFAEISGVDYPYGELNLVNDPAPALYGQAPSSLIYLGSNVFRGEGTMAGGGLFGLGTGNTGTAKFLKSVVAHEVGHQWWGSRVSNANQRNYWFVETLAEYFSAIFLEAVFGQKEYQEQVDEWRRVVLEQDQKSSVQHASVLLPGTDPGSYQAAVYNRGPYAFHLLREMFGDEKFFPFLKEFTQKLAKKGEIVTRDIQMVAEEALGGVDQDGNRFKVDLEWFFDQWIRGVGIPEYRFVYNVRPTEDGGSIVEGTIYQRVVVGNKYKKHVLEGKYYRGIVPITVLGKKGKEYQKRLLIEGPETPFQLKVPERPLDVVLNKDHNNLAHDVVVNKSW